jgi:hypothetical protein
VLPSHEKIQRKLKTLLLSENTQPEKATCYIIPKIQHSGKSKTVKQYKKKSSGFQELGEGGMDKWNPEGF